MSPQNHPKIYRNFAAGDARFRRGRHNLTIESISELSNRLKGQFQAFAMWLGYGEEFAVHYEQNGHSVKGWHGEAQEAFFDFIPFDFDADTIEVAFAHCRAFVENELLARGFDKRYFSIYLSGGKGFHVHVSPACVGGSPLVEPASRLKVLAKEWKRLYPSLDLSLYEPTRLLRLPGTKHNKTGLFKTPIPLELFTLEYLALRTDWAAKPSDWIPELSHEPPAQIIDLPALVSSAHPGDPRIERKNIGSTPSIWITRNCPFLKSVLMDPSGRDRRRSAIGVLLSAAPPGEPNPELDWFLAELFKHPYMTRERQDDTLKWVNEYERDGVIKVAMTCRSLGCEPTQRRICGTQKPLDWQVKLPSIETIPYVLAL